MPASRFAPASMTAAALAAAVIGVFCAPAAAAQPITFAPPLDGPPFANSGRAVTPQWAPPTSSLPDAAWFVVTDSVDCLLTPLTWESEDWSRLGYGAAAVGGAMLLDVGNFRFWKANQHDHYDGIAERLNAWGSGGRAMQGFAAGMLISWAVGEPYAMQVCAVALESAWVCGVIGRWGKGLSHRERPKTQGNNPDPLLFHGLPKPDVGSSAFPSGHTLGAWSWAWVIWDMVGGVPGALAVTMATGVALQRMYTSAHWLSDVTASILIARVVATRLIALSSERPISLTVTAWDEETAAVGVTMRW